MPIFNINTKWKDIIQFEGLYQISNTGLIKSLEREVVAGKGVRIVKETILAPGNNGNDYLFVYLWKDNKSYRFYVHQLVGLYYVNNDNIENYTEINHKDKDKSNNNDWNLEWCNSKQNSIHAVGISILRSDGKIYKSIKDCAIDNNISFTTMRTWINNPLYTKDNQINSTNYTFNRIY